MSNLSQYINWYPDILVVVLLDLTIAVALIVAMRRLSGVVGNVAFTEEISQKDNFAFGVSFGGALLAVTIMLTGAVSGEEGSSLLDEAFLVIAYGVLGIALMAISRFILDKISLPNISIHSEIMRGNIACAIVDASNMIATAIIVRAVMVWVDSTSLFGLFAVMSGFVVSQVLLVLVTKYRAMVYAKRHAGSNIQKAFEAGNQAIALRYLGHKIGVALAVTAASGFVPYDSENVFLATLIWGIFSLIMTIVLSVLAIAARLIVLNKINVVEEVDQQKNMGIGLIEATIYIAIGLLLAGLVS